MGRVGRKRRARKEPDRKLWNGAWSSCVYSGKNTPRGDRPEKACYRKVWHRVQKLIKMANGAIYAHQRHIMRYEPSFREPQRGIRRRSNFSGHNGTRDRGQVSPLRRADLG